jgi:hypothetical protein
MRTDDAAESPAIRLADCDPGAQSAIRSKQTVNAGLRAMKKRYRIVYPCRFKLVLAVAQFVGAPLRGRPLFSSRQ